MSLVDRIKQLCSVKNTTLIGLEREVGLGRGTIRNWDTNSPSVDKVQKVAEYFKVSLDDLIFGEEIHDMGHIVEEERENQGLSRKELAEEIGVSEDEIEKYELNEIPIRETRIEEIAKFFGMSWTELLDKYNLYDEYIPDILDKDVNRNETFKKALENDQAEDSNRKYVIDTVAAHLEGKNITPKKLKLIERYIEALFEDDDE